MSRSAVPKTISSILSACLFLLVTFSLQSQTATAFVVRQPPLRHALTQYDAPRSILCAKKRRRRKQTDESSSSSSTDLPDFDIASDDDADAPSKSKQSSSSSVEGDMSAISANMMGSKDAPVRSVKELLSDRSLESKFQFDESDQGESLPDLPSVAAAPKPMSEKRRKQAERKAKAQAMASMQAEETSFLPPNLPLDITNDKGEIQPIKVLEAGAWLGIALLILWEVYINSPLFERAAPMAPVVY